MSPWGQLEFYSSRFQGAHPGTARALRFDVTKEGHLGRALVVDDDPDQARLLAEILGEAGLDSDLVSGAEEALSRRRTGLHVLHRKLGKPWRALRRGFLRKQHESGRLESPTANLEDHDQPEKATWRTPGTEDQGEAS